jgi:TPR repeat protein
MQSFKSKVLLSVLVLTLPSYVNANTKSEELHFKVLDGIDKAGEMATLGVEKLFSPLHKGVEKLAKPYIEKNNAEYFFQLGQAYYKGDVYFNNQYIKKDDAKALEAWISASYSGSKIAPLSVGLMYFLGEGTAINKEKACEWFLRGALLGDASAQATAGACYYTGQGFPQNLPEALKWLSLAAKNGNKNAQFLLAEMYSDGQGVELNLSVAKEWYEKSAKQGHEGAQKKLDKLNSSWDMPYKQLTVADVAGKVIDGDAYFVSAANSAQSGDAKAQFELGVMYFKGFGMPQDYMKALDFFEKASNQGHERAKEYIPKTYFALGSDYFSEDAGERQDDQEAFKWFSKAAELGHAQSQYIVGLMYYFGEGIPKDESKGVQLIKQSAQNGFEEARKVIDEYKL